MPTKTCFVVMGFHEKKDPETGRVLDLDKTYKHIIKPAAQAAGFECLRADEIQHAGVIDVPMYDWLFKADLVIADLSTMNPNAFFELGVRYALRPRTTIVIAEDQWKNPFDTNHIAARKYRHDGKVLDIDVVQSFEPQLAAAIREIDGAEKTDSPVYTFLHELVPPKMEKQRQAAEAQADAAAEARVAAVGTPEARDALEKPLATMIDLALRLREQKKFAEMASILDGVRAAQGPNVENFILQQLALATYKAKQPTPTGALLKARDILSGINPRHSLDAETIGLWGAVHKRLADARDRSEAERRADLDEAIDALGRGFSLLRDHYNGINAAFLHDLRASRSGGDDAIADRVIARRLRTEVLEITESLLAERSIGETQKARNQRMYWLRATRAEALLGLGRKQEADEAYQEAEGGPDVEPWMLDSSAEQKRDLLKLVG